MITFLKDYFTLNHILIQAYITLFFVTKFTKINEQIPNFISNDERERERDASQANRLLSIFLIQCLTDHKVNLMISILFVHYPFC